MCRNYDEWCHLFHIYILWIVLVMSLGQYLDYDVINLFHIYLDCTCDVICSIPRLYSKLGNSRHQSGQCRYSRVLWVPVASLVSVWTLWTLSSLPLWRHRSPTIPDIVWAICDYIIITWWSNRLWYNRKSIFFRFSTRVEMITKSIPRNDLQLNSLCGSFDPYVNNCVIAIMYGMYATCVAYLYQWIT